MHLPALRALPQGKALAFACLSLFALAAPAQTVSVTQTNGDKSKLLQPQAALAFGFGNSSNFVINVDASISYQTMVGFGASLTDSSAWLIWNKLTPAQQAALMQDLFNPATGIGLSLLRQPMGASDFSASGNYTYDDMPSGKKDATLKNFSIAHDNAYLIPLLKTARNNNPSLSIMALPWSPPAWMKVSPHLNGGSLNPANFPALANYFVKFLQAYRTAGVAVDAIAVQNEPNYSTGAYPSMAMSAADQASFIGGYLGPAMRGAGLSAKLIGYEHNWDDIVYPETVLANSVANPYIAATGFHCYKGTVDKQSLVKQAYPAKDIWFTECTGTAGSDFGNDLKWSSSNLLVGATRNWSSTVSLWNLALDQNSGPTNGGFANGRGVVTINTQASPATVVRNVEYYILAHLAKFVRPGALRIDSNSFGPDNVENVAFKNPDGSLVLFVLNGAYGSNTFTVNWRGSNFNYTLPPVSVATFTWPATP
ncbi:MAG: glycoside hydrolase family 30 beta sandwich domain-containing protein [Pseudomonadota bacterium]